MKTPCCNNQAEAYVEEKPKKDLLESKTVDRAQCVAYDKWGSFSVVEIKHLAISSQK